MRLSGGNQQIIYRTMGYPRLGRKESEPGSNTNREANSKVLRRLLEEASLGLPRPE